MPFKSKKQWRAAFSGRIPGISKDDAREWAHETKSFKGLPNRAPAEKGKPTLRSKQAASLGKAPYLAARLRAQGFTSPVIEAFRDEAISALDTQRSPNAVRGHYGAFEERLDPYIPDIDLTKSRLLGREEKKKESPPGRKKKAEDLLASLCTKIAFKSLVKMAPKPSASSLTSVVGNKSSTVGRFSGVASANSLKPPGTSMFRQAVNPRRNLRQAMNAY